MSCPAVAAAQWGPQAEAPVTNDRLSPESMDALVAGPMAALRKSGLAAAQKAFDALLADAVNKHGKGSVEEADLLTAFGVALDIEGIDRGDEKLERAALPYIERAIPAYRAAFGPRHPEVALALNSYATLLHNFHDKALDPAAEAALVEAISIRTEKLGPDNPETKTAEAELAELRNPQADDALQALANASAAVATASATADLASGDELSAGDLGRDALWKPVGYANPLIDDFVKDVRELGDDAPSASKQRLAAKYGLSEVALDEGVALLRDMEKHAYDDRRKAGLRARALAWLKRSNRAPIALTYVGGILGQFEEGGCKAADVDLLMQGSRNRDEDLWAIASSCTSSEAFAAAIRRSDAARSLLLYEGTQWTRGDWPSELAAADMLLRPEFLAQVDAAQRERVHAEIARSKLMTLIYVGLLDEALRFGDSLDPVVLAMALEPKRGGFRATINGFAFKEGGSNDSPAVDYAAALALAGRAVEARRTLDLIAPLAKRKEARACLEAAKANCSVGTGQDIPLGALIVDQLLDDPAGDPYVLMEAATQGFSERYAGSAEALCRLLTRPEEAKECETAREATMASREPADMSADDRSLWDEIRQAGGPTFGAAGSRYAAMTLPWPEKAKGADWSRASVDPAPVPFRELSITPKMLVNAYRESGGPALFAALPTGYALIRRERSGLRAVAVSISTRLDPNGEVSSGGYWIHLSEDGGRTWGQPLYTGLAEYFPYVVPTKSRLPMLAGDHIRLEVEEALIDTATISYPPVGLHTRRKRSGIYLDIPIATLTEDSDGDGLTNIAAHHLLLDEKTARPTPFVVGQDRNCSAPNPEVVARLEILKKVFAVEGRALIEPPDKTAILGNWGRSQPSGKPPIFLLGNPADWRCVTLDRPMIVYSEDDQQRLRKFSPDFQLIELPPIRWNRAHTRGFVQWSMRWTGGTYRLTRKGDGWELESISEWIT
jgi:hypothetical protein